MTAARPRETAGTPPPTAVRPVLTGIGSWLPPDVLTNHDLERRLGTDDAWIHSRTGIRRRHLAAPGTTTSDLAVEAGRRALKSAEEPTADAVVLATTTPDRSCPATAPQVAARLGLSGVPAFDVAAVCSGFLYGLATAGGLLATGSACRVLLIAAETFSTLIDPADRSTAVIFADGAGAVVLRAGTDGEPGAFGPVVLGSDGDLAGLIEVPAGERYLRMQGRATFRQAVERMATTSRTAVAAAGWRLTDIDRLAAHQANTRILHALADELGLPPGHRLSNIEHVGNTAAASIPLLLDHTSADGRLRPGHRLVLTAFGAGLTWGATTLRWPDLPVPRDTP
ncbi:3-oxoacyl-ACP synthase [Streptomyces sp. CB02923]|uniref:beta-ketoacyl-ACP synthase III n=1 Tax=Streptomyces sp. CB02923 TaxID=1718985 RepID=UPI00093E3637|nr:beta-ketoacyl-ACP synthase III [Streptomyces sp. CB02923]OKI02371.1 3-oxoacyl-ACP synthase [Streptomyces sp. CB02923]